MTHLASSIYDFPHTLNTGGALFIKILKRTAKFTAAKDVAIRSDPQADKKLDIPKKTKLFVDQTMRERTNYESESTTIEVYFK